MARNARKPITTLAMPMDAALQQIKIECFFPADDATAEKARQLAL